MSAATTMQGKSSGAPAQRGRHSGGPPLLLEPVKARLSFRREVEVVNVLDHDGRRTGRTLPVKDGKVRLDGARDKALYYEVVFR